MIPNILSTVPSLNDEDVELTPEQEKAERIAFHRQKVRTGPVKFTYMTNGQLRRAQTRAAKAGERKRWGKTLKDHFTNKRTASFVRAHLQKIGIVPFLDGREVSLHDQIVSTAWIAQRFGVEVKTLDGKGTGHVSFRAADLMTAIEGSIEFVKRITGETISVPKGYQLAISSEDLD